MRSHLVLVFFILFSLTYSKPAMAEQISSSKWFFSSNVISFIAYTILNKSKATAVCTVVLGTLYVWEHVAHKKPFWEKSSRKDFLAMAFGTLEGAICGSIVRKHVQSK